MHNESIFSQKPWYQKQGNLKCLNLKDKTFFEAPPSTVVKNSYH